MRYTRSLGIFVTATLLATVALAGTAETTAAGATVQTAESRIPTEPEQMRKPLSQRKYERSMIEWIYQTFAEADLKAPSVAIRFSDDEGPCEGNRGTVRKRTDGSLILRVCANHPDPTVRNTWRRRTLVHEMSHVWIKANVDEQVRSRFIDLRGLADWNDRSGEWADRAVEHAAEIMTWGLGDESWKFVSLPDQGCQEMTNGYRLLTREDPARLSGSCD